MLPYLIPSGREDKMATYQNMLLQHQMELPGILQKYNSDNQIVKLHNEVTKLIQDACE